MRRELNTNKLTDILQEAINPSKRQGSLERKGGFIWLERRGGCLVDDVSILTGNVGGRCGNGESRDKWNRLGSLVIPYIYGLRGTGEQEDQLKVIQLSN